MTTCGTVASWLLKNLELSQLGIFVCVQWVLLARVPQTTSEENNARYDGLDCDIAIKEAKKYCRAVVQWMNTGQEGNPPEAGDYQFRMMGGNHKLAGLKQAWEELKWLKPLSRMRCKVFVGLTLDQQLKVSWSTHVRRTQVVTLGCAHTVARVVGAPQGCWISSFVVVSFCACSISCVCVGIV